MTPPSAPSDETVLADNTVLADCRVLTWNVWWRFDEWEARQALIANAVREASADVIVLQEAWRTAGDSQPDILADAASLPHVAWSPNRRSDRWRSRLTNAPTDLQCGLAVLSRWPILHDRDVELPNGTRPPSGRTALATIVDHPRGPLPIVATHLESHPARSTVRLGQVDAVAELVDSTMSLAGEGSLAPIVCGDFNAEPHSDEVRRFSGLQTAPHIEDLAFHDAWLIGSPQDPGWTWRTDNPFISPGSYDARIDYVFVGLSGRVLTTGLIGADGGSFAPSDHAGVVADLCP